MPSNKVWKIKSSSPVASKLALQTGISLLQAQLLLNRGVSDKASVNSFLHLQLADMADPMLMKGMSDALPLILNAANNRAMITIFGDYDADGLTATALLYNFFVDLDLPVSYYIPNRLNEGYSLNRNAIEKISKAGTGLIITVDCGISNEREISFAKDLGMEVIVTDHHQVPDMFKPVCPVINPHQPGCGFPFKDLAGVGVAFFLAVAIRAVLREEGWFKISPEPDLKEYLDLVALGTVGDRVKLKGQNRILVKSGIKVLAGTRWVGMKAMKDVADVNGLEHSAEDLAFRLAPRLNAPGRIDDPGLGIQVLITKDPISAKNLALRIDAANTRRRSIETDIYTRIENMIETSGGIKDRKVLFLGEGGLNKGVLGIVASRLVDKYYRPSLIYCVKDGLAVGSGRSIDGFDLFQALSRFSHLFVRFGGHSHAAGFTLKIENLKVLEKELNACAQEMLGDKELVPSIEVDAEFFLSEITHDTIQQINLLAPFGDGNPEPIFIARSLEVLESQVVGERHLKLKVMQAGRGRTFEAIAFGFGNEYPLDGRIIDMVFTPEVNRWQGHEKIQLRVVDLQTG